MRKPNHLQLQAPACRPVSSGGGMGARVSAASVAATQTAALLRLRRDRDECRCDDGPERMSARAKRGRW